MARPLIGITAYPRVVDVASGPTLLHTASRYYVDGVVQAGGYPVVLPVVDPALIGDALDRLDGLVLPGGGDVDPERYGEAPDATVHTVDPDRDAWDIGCVRAALDRRLPLLAICRGCQVVNVALGGSLIQDIQTSGGERHGWGARATEAVHPVELDPGSRLSRSLGVSEVAANSMHHQAVADLGAGVRPVGWAPDGTVEAIEVDERPEVVAVQWHPELLLADPVHLALFQGLIRCAQEK